EALARRIRLHRPELIRTFCVAAIRSSHFCQRRRETARGPVRRLAVGLGRAHVRLDMASRWRSVGFCCLETRRCNTTVAFLPVALRAACKLASPTCRPLTIRGRHYSLCNRG